MRRRSFFDMVKRGQSTTDSTTPARTYTYDDDGNLTQGYTPDGEVFSAEYDAQNRLISVEYGQRIIEYAYSGDGFLAEISTYTTSSGEPVLEEEIRIVRDGMLPLQDRSPVALGGSELLREYTWGQHLGGGIGGLLNLKQDGQNYAYLYDGKGNVSAVLDSAQNVVAAYRYDPFGNILTATGALEQPFQFSTKRYDPQTGLVYYGRRFYSLEMDRWTTRDPLGEKGGLNLYAFVGNNPVNYIDPWGLEFISEEEGCKIISAAEEFLGTPFSELQCSALVYNAYTNAGFPYEMTPTSSFTKQSKFKLVDTPQVGDVVFFGTHMGLYNPNPPGPRKHYVVLSATETRGVAYGPLSWFEVLLNPDEETQYFRYDK